MSARTEKPLLLIVGAFPPPGSQIFGGMVTACARLLASRLPLEVALDLLDTTQRTNPPPGVIVRSFYAVKRIGVFVARVSRRRPDAVLLFVAVGGSFYEKSLLAGIARAFGVPSLFFLRGGSLIGHVRNSRTFARIACALLRIPTRVLCQGPAWQEFLVKDIGLNVTRCPIIPNWTASPRLLKCGDQRKYRKIGTVRILFVGWVIEPKGILELLRALRGLLDRGLACELVVVGRGEADDVVLRAINDLSLDSHVRLEGWADRSATDEMLSEADIFALPSHAEGLPNAMIEAMATGLPVVVTTVGTIPDYVVHGVNGLLVAPRDVSSLTDALASLIADAGLRERLGRAARASAEQFDVEEAVTRLLHAVYDVSGRAGSTPGIPATWA